MRRFWNWEHPAPNNNDPAGDDTRRVLRINGVIAEESWFDDDITPALFASELAAGSGDVTVWINSPGGDVVAAAQIYNMLIDYPGHVKVCIDGIAASAASVIAMAGEVVAMSPVSMLMIHNPATLAVGDAEELGRVIDMLAAVKESIINAYELKTGMSRAKLARLMDQETWMDARAAIAMGFADDYLTGSRTARPRRRERGRRGAGQAGPVAAEDRKPRPARRYRQRGVFCPQARRAAPCRTPDRHATDDPTASPRAYAACGAASGGPVRRPVGPHPLTSKENLSHVHDDDF